MSDWKKKEVTFDIPEDPNEPDEEILQEKGNATERKKLHQNFSVERLETFLLNNRDEYVNCLIKRTTYCTGEAIPLDRDDIPSIHLPTTKSCGRTFNGDRVVVKIHPPETNNGQVEYYGSVEGILERSDNIYDKRFVCRVDDQSCSRMVPIDDGTVYFYIRSPHHRFKNNKVHVYQRTNDYQREAFSLKEKSSKNFEVANPNNNHRLVGRLFTVRFINWSMYHWNPYGYVEGVYQQTANTQFRVKYDVPGKHSMEMHTNAQTVVNEKLGALEFGPVRKNLTNLFIFTIDDENAKILDDAFSIQPCQEHSGPQCWKVGIHISDVASFVDVGSDIDKEAKKRLLSISQKTLPEDVGKMLPPPLGKQCSLHSNGKECFAVSTFFHSSKPPLNAGDRVLSKIVPVLSKIVPKCQLSYKEAQDYLNQRKSTPFRSANLQNLPQQLYFLWNVMWNFRILRLGPAAFYNSISNTDYDFDKYRQECMSRLLVEEAMITLNGFTANFFKQKEIPFVARAQPPPPKGRAWTYSSLSLHQTSVANAWKEKDGSNFAIKAKPFSSETMISLPEVWKEISSALGKGHVEKAVLLACCDDKQPELVAGLEEFTFVQSKVELKDCDHEDLSHFNLRLSSYVHCTSPIRRYPDLVAQRGLVNFLLDKSTDQSQFDIASLQNSLKKEKQAVDFCRAVDFHEKLDGLKVEYFAGYVVEANEFEIGVAFPSLSQCSHHTIIRMGELIPKEKTKNEKDKQSRTILQWSLRYYDQGIQNNGFCFEKRKTVKTETWIKFLSCLKEDSLLESNRDAVQKKLKSVADSLADKQEERPPSSVSKICRTSNGVYHGRKVEVDVTPYSKQPHTAVPLFFQIGIGLKNSVRTLVPQLLHFPSALGKKLKEWNLDICLSHRRNATMFNVDHEEGTLCQSNFEQPDFLLWLYYLKWIPLVRMDGVYSSIHSNSTILLEIEAHFSTDGLKGQFSLQNDFCDNCFIVIKVGDFLCFRERIKKNGEFHTWIGHGVVNKVPIPNDANAHKTTSVFGFTMFESVETAPREHGQKGPILCELIPLSVPHRRMCNALNKLGDTSPLVKAICTNKIKTLSPSDGYRVNSLISKLSIGRQPVGNFTQKLNDKQTVQVERALKEPVALIQGPPGTGKSFMGAHLAYYFCKLNAKRQIKGKVLYCGPSNKSVDVVAKYLMKFPKLDIVRVYGGMVEEHDFPIPVKPSGFRNNESSPVDAELKAVALHHVIRSSLKPHAASITAFDRKCKLTPEAVSVQEYKEFQKLITNAKTEELKENSIILCTCTVAGSMLISELDFAQVIIDESGMCTEPESLVPIVVAAKNEKLQVTLIGDHKQLQPVLLCRSAAKQGLITSMFESLKEHCETLTKQYRMHPTICEFVSDQFYKGKLENAGLVSKRSPSVLTYPVDEPTSTAMFWDVKGFEEEDESKSKYNTAQVKVVIQLLEHLMEEKEVQPRNIMVLSPYLAQCKKIKEQVSKSRSLVAYKDVLHIGSVVTSQGSEADYVILSTVRSSFVVHTDVDEDRPWLYKNIGFVSDDHQINVALSRAKLGLYVIGNRRLLAKYLTWRKLLESYERREAIYHHPDDIPFWRATDEDDDDDGLYPSSYDYEQYYANHAYDSDDDDDEIIDYEDYGSSSSCDY